MSGKSLDRSILRGESIELFRAAIRSPSTRDPYERRLIGFLKTVNLVPDDFIAMAKKNSCSVEKMIISFILTQNLRAQRGEITTATVGNCLKAVRLLLEMNDISLNWRKIRRILPRARRYALDRIPTIEEINEIIEASDIREKALTLVFVSSGIREGAIESLMVNDYKQIKRDEKIVAGRLVIYSGDLEMYVSFV
ncbi:MAG TPA: hypothetical protein VI278_12170, partial [Nitrososphaeraceae archaeon]